MITELYLVSTLSLVCGYGIDLAIGDPPNIPHPVCFIGNLVSKTEKLLRKRFSDKPSSLRLAGVLLSMIVIAACAIIPLAILVVAYKMGTGVFFVVQAVMFWQILATKSLETESMKVHAALETGSIEDARYAVSMIVGRDTSTLDKTGVAKAAIETVAENTCDGVIAPIFYCAIGGPVLGFIYKAINTMDSMVAYKNEKYIDFGRASAKLDDFANYLPARISAVFMMLACPICHFDIKNSFKIWKRDKRKHSSPNSAQTESVCAGALGIQLAGDAIYSGELHKKDFIGDFLRPVENDDIKRANKLTQVSSLLFLMMIVIITVLI